MKTLPTIKSVVKETGMSVSHVRNKIRKLKIDPDRIYSGESLLGAIVFTEEQFRAICDDWTNSRKTKVKK